MLGNFVYLTIDAATETYTIAFFKAFAEFAFFLGLLLLWANHKKPHNHKDKDKPNEHATAAIATGCGLEKNN